MASSLRKEHYALDALRQLLVTVGIGVTVRSLEDCVPSLWVALYESLFETRIPGVIRSSSTNSLERVHNVQLVLDELATTVLKGADLGHVRAEDIVKKQKKAILHFIEVFGGVADALIASASWQERVVARDENWDHQSPNDTVEHLNTSVGMHGQGEGSSLLQEPDKQNKRKRHRTPRKSYPRKFSAGGVNKRRCKLLLPVSREVNSHSRAADLQRNGISEDRRSPNSSFDGGFGRRKPCPEEAANIGNSMRMDTCESILPQENRDSDVFLLSAEEAEGSAEEEEGSSDFLEAYEEMVETAFPSAVVPKAFQDRVWTNGVKNWERALNDRLWRRKVQKQREERAVKDEHWRQIQISRSMEKIINDGERQKQRRALHSANAAFKEHSRRLVRMEKRQREAEEEVKRYATKVQIQDEKLVRELSDTYIRSHRSAIIEGRRAQKELKRRQQIESQREQDAKENFYISQIGLLQEQLSDARRDEDLVIKAHQEQTRKILRDYKAEARSQLRRMREKLEVDVEDATFREAESEAAMRNIRFDFKHI